jgi:hypothetical protein
MENLKEEIENIKTGVSKTVSDVSDILLERFKNPYITAFCISWLAFNWKPIVFFIFSNANVEYKILTIKQEYSDSCYYFWYPLVSAIIFLFLVPYLNLINEGFLRLSIRKRADYIKDQAVDKIKRDEAIALADIDRQDAIRKKKEGEQRELYLQKLEDQNQTLISELEIQRNTNLENNSKHVEELKKLNDHFSEIIDEHKVNYEAIMQEKLNFQNELGQTQDLNIEAKSEIEKLEQENSNLRIDASNNFYDQIQATAKYSLFQRNLRNIDRSDKLFVFADDQKVIETYNDNNEIMHLDAKNNTYIEPADILRKMNTIFFDEYYLGKNHLRIFNPNELSDELKNVTFRPRDRA